MLTDQTKIIEQGTFTYSPLGKAFKKQIKTIEDQGTKQVESLKALTTEVNKEDIKAIEHIFPKEIRSNETKNEIDKNKKWQEKSKQNNSKYETKKYISDFPQYETMNKTFFVKVFILVKLIWTIRAIL